MHQSVATRVAAACTLALMLSAPLVGCGSDGAEVAAETSTPADAGAGTAAPGPESAALALEEGRVVIDVREPAEYDAGHVQGAQLIDIKGADFADRIAELDPKGSYVVYCRSGNRSAVAAEEMRAIGLDVLDGGALDDMEAAGWPVES